MNLRTKLIISLGTITLIILALSVTVIHTLDRQHISMRELIDYNFSKVSLTEELKNETNVISREVRELLLTTSESVQNEKEATIYEAMQNISEIFHSLEQISLEEDEKQRVSNIQSLSTAYHELITNVGFNDWNL
jgi:phosphoglycerate-specific signal transduction histidine kinase